MSKEITSPRLGNCTDSGATDPVVRTEDRRRSVDRVGSCRCGDTASVVLDSDGSTATAPGTQEQGAAGGP
jgi:hypothetical protein